MTEEILKPITNKPQSEIYRILALDDTEHIQLLTVAALEAGHEVVPVVSIAQAMDFLDREDHVDVVVAAVHLQNESVFEFLKRMKTAPIHKDVKFIMICSSLGEIASLVDETVQRAASVMGVDKYLTMEQYDVDRLMKEIDAILPERLPVKESDPN